MKTWAAFALGTPAPGETPPPNLAGPGGRVRRLTWPSLVAILRRARIFRPRLCHSCSKRPSSRGAFHQLDWVLRWRLFCDASPWRRRRVPTAHLRCTEVLSASPGRLRTRCAMVKGCVSSAMDTLLLCICVIHAISFPEHCHTFGKRSKRGLD